MKKTAPPPPRRPSTLAAATADNEPAVSAGMAAALYFGLALVYFLPAFLPGRHIYGTDYLNAGYFFYDFVREQSSGGRLPGWVPYIYGGLPHFANPGSTYYPVLWISEHIVSTRLFLPVLFWVQFGMAGWGMYLLAREMGCRRWVAFVAGLAFQWTGILTSWVYAGHDGRIIVVTLAPLLFYFLHRGIRTARVAPFVGAAATVGFVLLSFQIQNAYYLLLAGFIWAVFLLVSDRVYRQPARLGKTVALGLAAVAFGFVLAAVNFLPFQDYVGQSPRGMAGGRGYAYSTSFSMPARAIVGVAVPEQVGANVQNDQGEYIFPVYRGNNPFRLHTEYLGALVVVLVALGAYYARRSRYWWFFTGLALFGLSLALGGNTPLYQLYYLGLPGLKRFRAPDLAYFVMALSLISMAAVTLERLAQLREARAGRRVGAAAVPEARGEREGMLLWIAGGVAAVAVAGAVLFGAGSAEMAEGTSGLTPAQGWMRFALFAAASAAALWAWWTRRMRTVGVLLALSLITTVDLWVIGKRFFQTVPGPTEMFAPDDVTAFLMEQPRPFRVFAMPNESAWPRSLDMPMMYGIEQAGGEHGNQLQRYNEYAGAGEQTYVDWHNLLSGSPRFMAAANVRYLVSSIQYGIPWLKPVFQGGNGIVYENTLALPRAYLVERVIPVAEGGALAVMQDSAAWNPLTTAVVEGPAPNLPAGPVQGNAQVTRHEPNRVTVRTTASRQALMVLSDNWYKDWHATVDGREVPILRANHTFRGVVVPQGTHTVEFTFRPRELYTGFAIYLAGLGLLALYGIWLLVAARRRRGEPEPGPVTAGA